jgi:hypothetical protein
VIAVAKEMGINVARPRVACQPSSEAFEKLLGGTIQGRNLAKGNQLDDNSKPTMLDDQTTYMVQKSMNLNLRDIFGKAPTRTPSC